MLTPEMIAVLDRDELVDALEKLAQSCRDANVLPVAQKEAQTIVDNFRAANG